MKLYKLTDQNGMTMRNTQWGSGVTHEVLNGGPAKLCTSTVIHAYESPLLAELMNPTHARLKTKRMWLAEGEVAISDGTKVGCKSLTTLSEITEEIPVITPVQRAAFGILSSLEVYKKDWFVKWASEWLSNKNRSVTVSNHIATTADVEAASSATNAANAANAATAAINVATAAANVTAALRTCGLSTTAGHWGRLVAAIDAAVAADAADYAAASYAASYAAVAAAVAADAADYVADYAADVAFYAAETVDYIFTAAASYAAVAADYATDVATTAADCAADAADTAADYAFYYSYHPIDFKSIAEKAMEYK